MDMLPCKHLFISVKEHDNLLHKSINGESL